MKLILSKIIEKIDEKNIQKQIYFSVNIFVDTYDEVAMKNARKWIIERGGKVGFKADLDVFENVDCKLNLLILTNN